VGSGGGGESDQRKKKKRLQKQNSVSSARRNRHRASPVKSHPYPAKNFQTATPCILGGRPSAASPVLFGLRVVIIDDSLARGWAAVWSAISVGGRIRSLVRLGRGNVSLSLKSSTKLQVVRQFCVLDPSSGGIACLRTRSGTRPCS